MIYSGGSYEEFLEAVCFLMEHGKERRKMGENACQTIVSLWNAQNAAEQCLRFYDNWLQGRWNRPRKGRSVRPLLCGREGGGDEKSSYFCHNSCL